MRKRFATAVSLGVSLFVLPACSGRLYKVAPFPGGAPPVISADNAAGLSVGAFALESDSALERFDANLPLAGVIAVDVWLINKSAGSFDSSQLKFELLDAAGKNLKPLQPKKALE